MFENYSSIDTKLFQPILNYPKFYAILYFIKYIQDYKSVINYDMAYSKTAHNYLFKDFYKKANKKKYKLQTLIYNICYIKVIAIQNVIFISKILDRSNNNKQFIIKIFIIKVI